jgi:RNA recognition motif-containing protein
MSKNADVVEKAFEQSDDEGEPHSPPVKEPPKDDTKETILQTSRLFVRNLSFSCTDEELADLFKPFGEISQVKFLVISLFFPDIFFKMIKINRDIRLLIENVDSFGKTDSRIIF